MTASELAHQAIPDHATFFFDLGSPAAYLVAERVLHALPASVTWEPILAPAPAHSAAAGLALEHQALAQGALPLRWPAPFPFDSATAMRAATYAKQIGRTAAFALAAFRQAFAAGRCLAEIDNVLIAAAACEMHPTAVLQALERTGVAQALEDATTRAGELGVSVVPALLVEGRVYQGADALDQALVATPS
jgi:2-hydroxychromene-2-carboxylate isomerase